MKEDRWDLLARSILILTTETGQQVRWKVVGVNAKGRAGLGVKGVVTVVSMHNQVRSSVAIRELDKWLNEGLLTVEVLPTTIGLAAAGTGWRAYNATMRGVRGAEC